MSLLLLLLLLLTNALVNFIIDIAVYYYFNYIAWIIYLYVYANIFCFKFVGPKIENSTRSKYFVIVDLETMILQHICIYLPTCL